MKIYLFPVTVLLMIFVSCNNSKGPDVDKSLMDTYNTTAPVPNSHPQPGDSGLTVETPSANPQNLQSTPEINQTAQVNPPHGQPGHDCAIPVGAPLQASSVQNSTARAPTPMSSPAINFPASPTAAPGSGSGRVNPPHGQPGHDCAIPVGAPLG